MSKSKKKVIVAKNAGFCFGVQRAVDMAEKEVEESNNLVCLGSLIHNPQVVGRLEKKGMRVAKDEVDRLEQEKVLLRSHGVSKEVEDKLKKNKNEVVDATCPFVKRAQLVAEKFAKEGLQVVIFGDPNHAEVIGIKSYAGENSLVVSSQEEAEKLEIFPRIGLLSQTTQKKEIFQQVALELTNHTDDLHIINTICSDTATKQNEVVKLAKKVDLMIVVGGKESSNTKKLFEISRKNCAKAYHIETVSELKSGMLKDVDIIGITAGASTPKESIEEVVEFINQL